MSLSTRLLRSKDTYSREAVADLLSTLAERIRSGTVTFDQGGNSLDIEVPDTVRLDIEIKDTPKTSGTKREVELELWWITGADGEAGPAGGVTIT